MRPLGIISESGLPVFLAVVDDWNAIGALTLPSGHSVILMVADASGTGSHTVYDSAERLIDAGTVYVCTWGADCERVHDIFDEAYVGDGSVERSFTVLTTWHSDDTLAEAVDFFLAVALPSGQHYDTSSCVAVVVGNENLGNSVQGAILASEHSSRSIKVEGR